MQLVGLGLQLVGARLLLGHFGLSHLLLEGLGHLLGLLALLLLLNLLRRGLGVRIGLAVQLANARDQLLATGDVGEFHHHVEQVDGHLGRELAHQVHHGVEHRHALALAVVLLIDDEIGLLRRDVVQIRAVFLLLVDLDPIDLAARAGESYHLGLGVKLFSVRELQFALQLGGIAQIVEGLGSHHGTLILARENGPPAGGVGLAAEVFIGHPAHVLDHARVAVLHLHVRVGQLAIDVHFELLAFGVDDDAVRPGRFFAQLIQVLDRPILHDDLVGGEDEQRLRGAFVQVFLRVADVAHHAVGRVVPGTAIAPDRGKRKAVVPVRTFHVLQQDLVREDRAAHLHQDRVVQLARAPLHCGDMLRAFRIVGLAVVDVPVQDLGLDRVAVPRLVEPNPLAPVVDLARRRQEGAPAQYLPRLQLHRQLRAEVELLVVVIADQVRGYGGAANLVLPVGEHGDADVQVHPLLPEDIAGVRQVTFQRVAVVPDIAPRLVAAIQRIVGRVASNTIFEPAQAGHHRILESTRPGKAGLVDVADVLQHLRLDVRQVVAGLAAGEDMEVDARALFRAQDPVAGRLDLVVDQGRLPALLQFEGILVGILDAVVEILIDRLLVAIDGLLLALLVEPVEQPAVQVHVVLRVQRVPCIVGRRLRERTDGVVRGPAGDVLYSSHQCSTTFM